MAINKSQTLAVSLGTTCALCGAETESLMELPDLPLTDTFTRDDIKDPIHGINQTFRFCDICHHGQLENYISPEILYGGNMNIFFNE